MSVPGGLCSLSEIPFYRNPPFIHTTFHRDPLSQDPSFTETPSQRPLSQRSTFILIHRHPLSQRSPFIETPLSQRCSSQRTPPQRLPSQRHPFKGNLPGQRPTRRNIGHGSQTGSCCDMDQSDTIGNIELIVRMTFNRFVNCLMSIKSMEITINTYRG